MRATPSFAALLLSVVFLCACEVASAQEGSDRPVEKTRGWPLYSAEVWADGRTERDALFSLYHTSRDSRGHVTWVAPFYYSGSKSASESSWSILLPFYYWRKNPDSWRFWSLPFDRGTNTSGVSEWWSVPGFLPLVEHQQIDESSYTRLGVPYVLGIFAAARGHKAREYNLLTLAPRRTGGGRFSMFRYARDDSKERVSSQLFPLYFHETEGSRDSTRGSLVLVPFLSYHQWSPQRRFHLLGLLAATYEKSHDRSAWAALFGLVASGKAGESRWTRIEPLYSHETSPASEKFHVLHLYGRETNTTHDVTVHRFLDPLGRFESGPGYYRHRLLPFYMAAEQGDVSYRYVFPFYGYRKTATSSLTSALLLYYDFQSEQKALKVLAPFYMERRNGERTRRVLLPLYYGVRSPERDFDLALPVFWRSHTKDRDHWTLFPLYSQTSTATSKLRVLLGPVYVGRTTTDEEQLHSHSLLWPFFTYRKGKTEQHFHALPLVWHTRRGDDRLSLLAPFYLRASDKDHDQHWILPVWGEYTRKLADGGTRKRSFYGLGAVMRGEARDADGKLESRDLYVLGSVFQHKKQLTPEEASTTSLLWPLISREKSPSRSHFHALPFAWYTRDGAQSMDLLAPLYYRSRDGDESRMWVFPTWFSESTPKARTRTLVPLYFENKRFFADREEWLRLVVGTLWFDSKRERRRERGVLWPLTRWIEGDKSGFDALFLLSRRKSATTTKTRLSPLYYAGTGADEASIHRYWHFFSRESGDWGHRTSVGWYLYASSARGTDSSRSGLFGLVGARESENHETRWLLPFYYQARSKQERATGDGTLLVLPFYYHSVQDQGKIVTRSILPPFFDRYTNANTNQARTSLLLGLFSRETGPGRSSLSVFPLFSSLRDASGNRRLTISALYASRFTGADGEVEGVWSRDGYFGWQLVRYAKGKHTRTLSLHPFLYSHHRNTSAESSNWNAFLFTASGHRGDKQSGFQVLGFLRGASDEQRSYWGAFPLCYSHEEHQRDLEKLEWQQLTNLVYRGEDANQKRWSLLTPLVFSFASAKKGSDYDFRILHKGVEFRRNGTNREAAIRPFFSYENDPASGYSYLSLLEILYRSEKKGHDQKTKRRLLWLIPLP